jgi:hypothetical protein
MNANSALGAGGHRFESYLDHDHELAGHNVDGMSATITMATGCSAAWLARLLWEQEAAGSNPASPTVSALSDSRTLSMVGAMSWATSWPALAAMERTVTHLPIWRQEHAIRLGHPGGQP